MCARYQSALGIIRENFKAALARDGQDVASTMTPPDERRPVEQERLARRLIPDAAITLALRVLGLLAQVAAFVAIARTHSLSDVGLYAVANTTLLLARTLGPCGMDYAAYRFCSGYFDGGDRARAAGFTRFAARRVLKLSGLVGLLLLASAFALRGAGFVDPGTALLLALAALGIPAYSLFGLFSSLHRSSGSMAWAQVPDGFLLPLALALGVGASAMWGTAAVAATLSIQIAAAWLLLLASMMRWRARVGGEVRSLEREEAAGIVGMANRVLAGVSIANLAVRSHVLLVSATLGPAAAGLFEAASRFGSLATMTSFAANAAVAPLMARARVRSDARDQQDLYTIASAVQALPALGILLALLVAGRWLLSTFVGEAFAPAYWPMVLLAFAELVSALGGPASAFLMMSGREAVLARYSALSLAIAVVGIPLAGTMFGLLGAAAVPVVCEVVRAFGMTRAVWQMERIKPGVLSPSELLRCVSWIRAMRIAGLGAALRFGR